MKWLLLGCLVLIVLVILEGKRQERIYGRSGRSGLAHAGLLELQRHLEPEKKVEIVLEKRERTIAAESGDPPERPGDNLPPKS